MKRIKQFAGFVCVVLALVLTGCTEANDQGNVDTYNNGEYQDVVPETANIPLQEAHGANAGPSTNESNNDTGYIGTIDASQEAHDRFVSWWHYEVQTPQDQANYQVEDLYGLGVVVCAKRALNESPPKIVDYLTEVKGMNGSSAQAVMVASHKALCWKYDTGYKSYFDKNVEMFQSAVNRSITFSADPPAFVDYGDFMKFLCWGMLWGNQTGGTIYQYMVDLAPTLRLSNLAMAPGTDPSVMYVFMKEAVMAGCLAFYDNLPPVIATVNS